MNKSNFKTLFGGKTVQDILKDAGEKIRDLSNPNTVNYFEVEKGNGWSTQKHVYISAKEGKGKLFYSKWVKYIGKATWIEKGSKLSYTDWLKERKKNCLYVGLSMMIFAGLIFLII